MQKINISDRNATPWMLEASRAGMIIHNAPRPLLGNPAPGEYCGMAGAIHGVLGSHGVFFVSLDPSDTMFDRFAENNENMDAREVVISSDATLHAEFVDACDANGADYDEVIGMFDGDWRAAARTLGIPA